MSYRNHAVARWAIAIATLAAAVAGLVAEEAVWRTEAASAIAQESSGQEGGLDTMQRLRSDLEEAQVQIDALRQEFRMLEGRFQARFHRFMDRRWENVTTQREQSLNYTNDFDVPIEVSLSGESTGNTCYANVIINGVTVANSHNFNTDSNKGCFVGVTVPPGSKYQVSLVGPDGRRRLIRTWFELRPPVQ